MSEELLKPRPDWQMPAKIHESCPHCEEPSTIVPGAYNTGDGWLLAWMCDNCWETWSDGIIDWPFGDDDNATARDLKALGFVIV